MQIKEQKTKTRGTLFLKKRCLLVPRQLKLKFPHCQKWPSDTKDKNAIKNVGVLTSDIAIITFGECV